LIENEDTDQWVRGAALSSLVTLVASGQKSRDQIVSYFAGLFRGKLVRKWSHAWDTLVSYSSDLYPEELLGDIKKAYEDDLVDPGYIGFDDVERDLAIGKERILARLADNPHRRLVEDTVAEMGWWACFRDDRAKNTTGVAPNSKLSPASSSRISRATSKIGRNEPCPCGSAKKYKKCCGAWMPETAPVRPLEGGVVVHPKENPPTEEIVLPGGTVYRFGGLDGSLQF
jgi:hypothetical protein